MKVGHSFLFVVLGGCLAIIPALCMTGGYPTPLSPYPIFFLLPRFTLGPIGALFYLLLPIFFWAWSHQLRSAADVIPRRSVALFILIAILSVTWTLAGYADARHWQGNTYAQVVALINISVPLLLGGAIWRNHIKPRWARAFIFHWLLFAWLGSYAFAYMGETP